MLHDADGKPLKRNFVHLDDLTGALLLAPDSPVTQGKTCIISMDEPVDHGQLAAHLKATRGLSSIAIPGPFHSTRLDNSRARCELGWRPQYDLARRTDASFDYQRAPDDPRKVRYPG